MLTRIFGGGGGDGGVLSTTVTDDLNTKISRYLLAEKPLRVLSVAGNDSAKERACADLKVALEQKETMADDAFRTRWVEYGAPLIELLDRAGSTYRAYKEYARSTLTNKASEFNARDVEKLREHVDGLKKYGARMTAYWKDDNYRSQRSSRVSGFGESDVDKEFAESRKAWTEVDHLLQDIDHKKLLKYIGKDPAMHAADFVQTRNALVTTVNRTRANKTDSTNAVSKLKEDLDKWVEELSAFLDEAYEKLRHPSGDSFDPRKAGFEDFLTYSGMPSEDLRSATPAVLITQEEAAKFKGELTLSYFNNKIGTALTIKIADMRARTSGWLRKVSAGADGRNPEIAMRKTLIDQLDKLLAQAVMKLPVSSANGPPPELKLICDRLTNPQLTDALNGGQQIKTMSPGDGKSQSPYSTAASSSSPNGASPSSGVPGIGFLFRTIDAARAYKYLEQIERFRDEVVGSRVVEFAESQAKRLAETLSDLEGQATALVSKGIDDAGAGGATSAGELSLRLRQLGLAKVAAAKSFARGVKSAAAGYATMHLRFVSERHGEAMRYMRYWDELVASAKGDAGRLAALGVDDACKTAIEDHKKVIGDLVKSATKTLVEEVRKTLIETQRDLASSGQPRLDDDQQAETDRRLDALSALIVDRAERIEDTYLRGAPTMLESIAEPMTLMLYGLKAVRLGCAAAALNVASGTFQNLYVRRVYTLDAPPPNPAILVALAIGLDAALSAVVFLVLFTTMRVFKTAENDFPVDPELLWTWLHDYVATTLAVGALSLIVCEVVRSKKYFRYKYEGERGIRAMREMMWYVYCVLLPIPFYRLLG